MALVTRETLASNPFRTLALSGSAGQPAIESAARRMRIWTDPSSVPPTPWDLLGLGPLRRSRSDVEQAVALLNDPVSRLERRLLWFCGQGLPTTVTDPATGSVADRHAEAIADLYAAWARPDDDHGVPWSAVVRRIVEVHASPDLLPWVRQTERSGEFEKRASDEEIEAIAEAVPAAVAAGLIPRAMDALHNRHIDTVLAIAAAVALAPAPPEAKSPIRELLDRMEDFATARLADMEKDLRDHLSILRQTPEQSYPGNLQTSTRASGLYVQVILPAVSALLTLAADDPDRLIRLRTRCGEVLILLALGWEWSGRFVVAVQQLQNALTVAQGTPAEAEARRELARVAPLAALERDRAARGVTNTLAFTGASQGFQTGGAGAFNPQAWQPVKKHPWRVGLGLTAAGAIALVYVVVAVIQLVQRPAVPALKSPARLPALSAQPRLPTPPDPAALPNPLPADPPGKSVGDAYREP